MEHCDSLQSFFMLHSLGGGTGSGLGSYLLELLEDEFPGVYRQAFAEPSQGRGGPPARAGCLATRPGARIDPPEVLTPRGRCRFSMPVFPSKDDDVVTSPYNALLSLHSLSQHADCVLPIENQALLDICNRIQEQGQRVPARAGTAIDGSGRGRSAGDHSVSTARIRSATLESPGVLARPGLPFEPP